MVLHQFKRSICIALIALGIPFLSFSQCAECPSGSTTISGTTNISDQNNTVNYCITGTWTGTISGIGNNSTVTICPDATWELPSNVTLQQNILITNYGSITDLGTGYKFKIQGQTDLINESSGSIEVTDFENQDTDFTNLGSLIAQDIYFHGPTSNAGTIESTADCGGSANTGCGFYIGNKGQAFNNTGTVTVVDGFMADAIIGDGTFNSTGTLTFQSNGAMSANNFFVNNLNLQASSLVNSGTFVVEGDFNCNNANVSTSICLVDGSGNQTSNCSNNSDPIVQCSTLPAEFLSFEVKQISKDILFTWEIGDETDVEYYEILHSPVGDKFTSLARINASNQHIYQHVHKEGIQSVFSYFKIRSIDFDGTISEYDKIRVLKNEESLTFKLSPNPVKRNSELNISYANPTDALIEIYDLTGKKIHSKFFTYTDNISLALDKIQISGLYLVKLVTPQGVFTKEIFIE